MPPTLQNVRMRERLAAAGFSRETRASPVRYNAVRRMSRGRPARRIAQTGRPKGAFTLVELLVVIAIIATLMALVIPQLNQALATGRRAMCASNLRQIGMGVANYAAARNNEIIPNVCGRIDNTHQHWVTRLRPYLSEAFQTGTRRAIGVYSCPDQDVDLTSGHAADYGKSYNFAGYYGPPTGSPPGASYAMPYPHRLDHLNNPSTLLGFADSLSLPGYSTRDLCYWHRADVAEQTTFGITFRRHGNMANVLYWDFHLQSQKQEEIPANWNIRPWNWRAN